MRRLELERECFRESLKSMHGGYAIGVGKVWFYDGETGERVNRIRSEGGRGENIWTTTYLSDLTS